MQINTITAMTEKPPSKHAEVTAKLLEAAPGSGISIACASRREVHIVRAVLFALSRRRGFRIKTLVVQSGGDLNLEVIKKLA